jgi:hypothetical protein
MNFDAAGAGMEKMESTAPVGDRTTNLVVGGTVDG